MTKTTIGRNVPVTAAAKKKKQVVGKPASDPYSKKIIIYCPYTYFFLLNLLLIDRVLIECKLLSKIVSPKLNYVVTK